MRATPYLLSSLDTMAHETTRVLDVLERHRDQMTDADRREVKRRVLELRGRTQELFDWLSTRLEDPKN